MRITINKPDGLVGIGGEFRLIDLSALDPWIRCVQYDTVNQKGHIEFDMENYPERINETIHAGEFGAFQWAVDAWNALTPAPVPDTPPTLEQLRQMFLDAVQVHLDTTVQAKGYMDGVSCASYFNDPHLPFNAEAQAFVTWRSNVWLQCYADFAQVVAGTKPIPVSPDAYIATLPVLVWP